MQEQYNVLDEGARVHEACRLAHFAVGSVVRQIRDVVGAEAFGVEGEQYDFKGVQYEYFEGGSGV
jgi:hypothetical protein